MPGLRAGHFVFSASSADSEIFSIARQNLPAIFAGETGNNLQHIDRDTHSIRHGTCVVKRTVSRVESQNEYRRYFHSADGSDRFGLGIDHISFLVGIFLHQLPGSVRGARRRQLRSVLRFGQRHVAERLVHRDGALRQRRRRRGERRADAAIGRADGGTIRGVHADASQWFAGRPDVELHNVGRRFVPEQRSKLQRARRFHHVRHDRDRHAERHFDPGGACLVESADQLAAVAKQMAQAADQLFAALEGSSGANGTDGAAAGSAGASGSTTASSSDASAGSSNSSNTVMTNYLAGQIAAYAASQALAGGSSASGQTTA